MSIAYIPSEKRFILKTCNTEYVMDIVHDRFLCHRYYGDTLTQKIGAFTPTVRSFAPYYKEFGLSYCPDLVMSEYSGFDSGDFRACSLRVKNSGGDSITVLNYRDYRIFSGREDIEGLPYANADSDTETLEIRMYDSVTELEASIYYTVFEKDDVISRYARLHNASSADLEIEKCMSLLLDIDTHELDMISLHGDYAAEREYQRCPLHMGMQSICSRRGASSHQANPFFVLCDRNATEESGRVFGFNFVYSGSFLEEVEVDRTGGTRVLIGLGSENFRYLLKPNESFTSPEAVMTYTSCGIGQMSRNFHKFIRDHILPSHGNGARPVVLNTWEACNFAIDEAVIEEFARECVKCNIDMLVMDDGWFGERDNDRAGLGDWYANRRKFKDGLKAFVDKIKSYGIKFGIWIEPEMVNPNSDLFRAHPQWCLRADKRDLLESRQQLVLDMCNPDVIQYLKDTFSKTFDGIDIDYFKWDMNRHMSCVASPYLARERQGETSLRYMLGVYSLMSWFRDRFPNAMIENCSGGGGRYDLGMMKYSDMIWASDNTDPVCRIKIQYSSMLGYPASTMSCHVANHNNAIENKRSLTYRYHTALGGHLGYEFDIRNASDSVRDAVRDQISMYHGHFEDLILNGDHYRIYDPYNTNYSAYYYINQDKTRILLSFLQSNPEEEREIKLPISHIDPSIEYTDILSGKRYSGKELSDGIKVYSKSYPDNSYIFCFEAD